MTPSRSRCVSCFGIVPSGDIVAEGKCEACVQRAPLPPGINLTLPRAEDGRMIVGREWTTMIPGSDHCVRAIVLPPGHCGPAKR